MSKCLVYMYIYTLAGGRVCHPEGRGIECGREGIGNEKVYMHAHRVEKSHKGRKDLGCRKT
jgi:hypothetical protein